MGFASPGVPQPCMAAMKDNGAWSWDANPPMDLRRHKEERGAGQQNKRTSTARGILRFPDASAYICCVQRWKKRKRSPASTVDYDRASCKGNNAWSTREVAGGKLERGRVQDQSPYLFHDKSSSRNPTKSRMNWA